MASTVVGAPVAALMLAFDAVSILLDMGDPEGYNNFTENAITQRALRAAWARMQSTALQTRRDYPMTFPVEQAFPEAWASAVMPALYEMVGGAAFGDLTEAQIERLADAAADGGDLPEDVGAALDAAYQRHMHADPAAARPRHPRGAAQGGARARPPRALPGAQQRDARRRLPLGGGRPLVERRASRGVVPLPRRVRPPGVPEGEVDPPVALISPTPTTCSTRPTPAPPGPNMVPRTVPGGAPAALYLVGGHLVKLREAQGRRRGGARPDGVPGPAQGRAVPAGGVRGGGRRAAAPAMCTILTTRARCERPGGAHTIGDGALPLGGGGRAGGHRPARVRRAHLGGTGRFKGAVGCLYTDWFCTRVGMKHRYDHETKASDCWKDGGQDMSESLFGTTITRGIQRGVHDLIGKVCDPCCAPDEYCEDRKCHKKKELGRTVGPTASWKCLSGHEQWAKCVECKDVDADCDGKPRTSARLRLAIAGGVPSSPRPRAAARATPCAPKRRNCVPTDKGKCRARDGDAACLEGGGKWEKEWDRYGCDDDAHCADGYCDRTVGQVNRCRRRDAVKGRKAGDFLKLANDQCEGGMICRHHTCVDLRNEWKNCWAPCGKRPGGCPQFCGKDGACCRHNENQNYPECQGHGPAGWSGCIERKDGREGEDFVSRRTDVPLDGACVVDANCTSGRCRGRTCRPKLDRGGKCATGGDCKPGLLCRHGTCLALRNEWKNCWGPCGRRGGGCPQFCGADGACCRHNEEKGRPECRGHGPAGWHSCIERKDGKEGQEFEPAQEDVPAAGPQPGALPGRGVHQGHVGARVHARQHHGEPHLQVGLSGAKKRRGEGGGRAARLRKSMSLAATRSASTGARRTARGVEAGGAGAVRARGHAAIAPSPSRTRHTVASAPPRSTGAAGAVASAPSASGVAVTASAGASFGAGASAGASAAASSRIRGRGRAAYSRPRRHSPHHEASVRLGGGAEPRRRPFALGGGRLRGGVLVRRGVIVRGGVRISRRKSSLRRRRRLCTSTTSTAVDAAAVSVSAALRRGSTSSSEVEVPSDGALTARAAGLTDTASMSVATGSAVGAFAEASHVMVTKSPRATLKKKTVARSSPAASQGCDRAARPALAARRARAAPRRKVRPAPRPRPMTATPPPATATATPPPPTATPPPTAAAPFDGDGAPSLRVPVRRRPHRGRRAPAEPPPAATHVARARGQGRRRGAPRGAARRGARILGRALPDRDDGARAPRAVHLGGVLLGRVRDARVGGSSWRRRASTPRSRAPTTSRRRGCAPSSARTAAAAASGSAGWATTSPPRATRGREGRARGREGGGGRGGASGGRRLSHPGGARRRRGCCARS